ncbi:hypothetical protein GCM10027447_38290 [Glycomyces halotolerans]
MTHEPTPSRAAFKGHPLHPALIPLPIGLAIAAFAADLGYWIEGSRAWALAAVWLIGGALVSGVMAAATGLVDFLAEGRIRRHRQARLHGIGNGVVLVLLLITFLVRLPDVENGVLPWGVVLTALGAALLGYTGWLGGELSYRHMFGVNPR